MREYKSDEALYQKIVEAIRAFILEPGETEEETVAMMWLFRESGCMHDIFSAKEQEQVQNRLIALSAAYPLYRLILDQELHRGGELAWKNFLNWKHDFFKNPYLQGINLCFPYLDRRQSVFIDQVVFGTTVQGRCQETMRF